MSVCMHYLKENLNTDYEHHCFKMLILSRLREFEIPTSESVYLPA